MACENETTIGAAGSIPVAPPTGLTATTCVRDGLVAGAVVVDELPLHAVRAVVAASVNSMDQAERDTFGLLLSRARSQEETRGS